MEFKLVYGNHGKDPFHIMDTLLLILRSLESLGYKADLEERMTPGKTNILLECFTFDFVEAMKDVSKAAGTEFIIVGTEFLTGQTFNNFDTGEERTLDSHYDIPDYWRKRFRTFIAAQKQARAIWHLAESQVDAFKAATGHANVCYLPHGYVEGFARVRHKPEAHKDIDAIFTGTLTRHRSNLIHELKQRGINAIATKPLNFVQREDLIARAKIALNLKQTSTWLYPSNSRYHYHLSNDSLMVSEDCPVACDLSPYILTAPGDQFTDLCCEAIAAGNWLPQARMRKELFMSEQPMTRLMHDLLDKTYCRV
jgi:hypothetical protein